MRKLLAIKASYQKKRQKNNNKHAHQKRQTKDQIILSHYNHAKQFNHQDLDNLNYLILHRW